MNHYVNLYNTANEIYHQYTEDSKTGDFTQTKRILNGEAGCKVGSIVGAKLGVYAGTFFGPIATVVGGVAGGVAGCYVGKQKADEFFDAILYNRGASK